MMNMNDEDTKMLHFLTSVYQALSQKKTVDVRDIHDMLEIFMVQYQNFEVSMSEDVTFDLKIVFKRLLHSFDAGIERAADGQED
jgi:hypothetical protein